MREREGGRDRERERGGEIRIERGTHIAANGYDTYVRARVAALFTLAHVCRQYNFCV